MSMLIPLRTKLDHGGGGRTVDVPVDVPDLEHELAAAVAGEVRFDDGSRHLYATDSSNYRQVPIGVVLPRTVDDLVAAVAVCHRLGAPIVARGGGTSLAGQTCNVAVVIDTSKYLNHVLSIDPERRTARVQPGVRLDDLRHEAEKHHLTFGPDPSTHAYCTLGGMIGNDSCGVHSVMAGRTVDNVVELDILTYDGLRMQVGKTDDAELERIIAAGGRRGRIYRDLKALRDRYAHEIRARYPAIPRRVSGYNLDDLLPEHGFDVARALVGTEGTCALVLEATVRLVPSPPGRAIVVLGYPDVYSAGDHVVEVMRHRPIGLEGLDDLLIQHMRRKALDLDDVALLPEGRGWLLAEFGGETNEDAAGKAREMMEALRDAPDAPTMRLYELEKAQKIWDVREAGLGATAFVPGEKDTWEGWEDSAVPPAALGHYLRELRALLDRYGYACVLYGHFGDGCVHTRIDFDLTTPPGIQKYAAFLEDAADLVLAHGGSLSGEHGDGQSKAMLLPKMFGNELIEAFRRYKAIWDPDGRMNPGKIVDPYRSDENLRLGPTYEPLELATHFQFPDDEGSFARAALRCVGVGKCRRTEGGTMCPSFRVTHEEQHTTRGRAHLLFEMMRGDGLPDGWRNEAVREALDLCLACKGCKGDCPVNVDMATYKAEFLSHYYEGRVRPLAAYSMGLIHWWARLARFAPRLVNAVLRIPLVGRLFKALGGIAPERALPRFAPRTFRSWFRARPVKNRGAPPVLFWPDTFNDNFHPDTAIAAVEVLEDAGYQVVLPEATLCCGRPLYDFGMLDLAKGLLRRTLDALRPHLQAGVPVVGIEPSCVAVFRDELVNLFPHDLDAQRLKAQTYLFSEFFEKVARHYTPPPLDGKAIVHAHCHHRAVMGVEAEEAVLRKVGLDFELLDSGCCGMAGSFGFEKEHYAVSQAVGEQVLLPAVRNAGAETLVVANGFSCREQIAQGTERRALHLAEVMQLGLRRRDAAKAPERLVRRRAGRSAVAALLPATAAILASAALFWARRRLALR